MITKRITELRDQFNGSRLRIGMTEDKVQSLMGQRPLETGKWDGGAFKLYGSEQSFDILPSLHYANILVLFDKDNKVSGIYSGETVPGGAQGLRELRESVIDFVPREKKTLIK